MYIAQGCWSVCWAGACRWTTRSWSPRYPRARCTWTSTWRSSTSSPSTTRSSPSPCPCTSGRDEDVPNLYCANEVQGLLSWWSFCAKVWKKRCDTYNCNFTFRSILVVGHNILTDIVLFSVMWQESRIWTNNSIEEDFWYPVSLEFLDLLWIPNIFIYNLKSFSSLQVLKRLAGENKVESKQTEHFS